MNYRHIYHAGNFADVVKHVVLTRIVEYLKKKDKAFRVIDTHAGAGLYDLSSEQAQKTGEWRAGIGRLRDASLPAAAAELLAPYLDAVASFNSGDGIADISRFAGAGAPTPAHAGPADGDRTAPAGRRIAQDAIRRRLPGAGDRTGRLAGARRASAAEGETRAWCWSIRPSRRMASSNGWYAACRRRTGAGRAASTRFGIRSRIIARSIVFARALAESGIPDILDIALELRAPSAEPRLDGCGVVVVNPPYALEAEMRVLLPVLAAILCEESGRTRLDWIAGEATARA